MWGDRSRSADSGRDGEASDRVLVVEDHRDVREIFARVLAMHGYEVRSAANGAEALAALAGGGFAALVCDLGLPDIPGIEVIEAARKQHPEIAVIVLTGLTTAELAQDLFDKGCDAILLKPLPSLRTLPDAVKEILKRRRGEAAGR